MTERKSKGRNIGPPELLRLRCKELLESKSAWREALEADIPSKWEKHGDLALLPSNSFADEAWAELGAQLWQEVCTVIKVDRLARKAEVSDDGFRSSRASLIYGGGGDTWVWRVENGVRYEWDLAACMFSAGNVGEKLRLARLDCSGETVVDMFAGIGYFSLPLLVHAKAAFLHACEWNPAAVRALKRNLRLNAISQDRFQIHEGDNREVCPKGVADRVNLGLIPTAESSYSAAVAALRQDAGGVLHIHGNVKWEQEQQQEGEMETEALSTTVRQGPEFSCKHPEWRAWALETAERIRSLWEECKKDSSSSPEAKVTMLLVTKIKSYAPRVDHLVLDLKCS